MSAEVLREAAALMRSRAEAALDLPWDHIGSGRVSGWFDGYGEALICDAPRKSDAEHIASWHPAVALAVADWLDACALVTEVAPDRHKGLALAVATAYLGTSA